MLNRLTLNFIIQLRPIKSISNSGSVALVRLTLNKLLSLTSRLSSASNINFMNDAYLKFKVITYIEALSLVLKNLAYNLLGLRFRFKVQHSFVTMSILWKKFHFFLIKNNALKGYFHETLWDTGHFFEFWTGHFFVPGTRPLEILQSSVSNYSKSDL